MAYSTVNPVVSLKKKTSFKNDMWKTTVTELGSF